MKQSQAEQLCTAYGLGTLVAGPQAVSGGLLHHMWRLTTTEGVFAVKQLNPAIMRKPGIHEAYRLSEQIAQDMAARGIPALAALEHGRDQLYIADDTCIVYPWVDGHTISAGPATPEQAYCLGTILAHIHALDLQYPTLPPLAWKHFHDEDWDILTFQAADMNLPWANPVRAALPMLMKYSHCYEDVGKTLGQHLVVSHCDLDQKNVLWQQAPTPTPILIDWEAAGLINPTMELAGLALNWSGQPVGEADTDSFAAVMQGYVQADGKVQACGIDAIHGHIGTWLGWLLFNMRRSLGEAVTDEEERQLGVRETMGTLHILRSIVAHADTWAGWVDRWR